MKKQFKYHIGMFGTCANPLHIGHLNIIYQASYECEKLYIVLSYNLRQDNINYRKRYQWIYSLTNHLNNIEIILLEDKCKNKEEYSDSDWKIGAEYVKKEIGEKIDVIYCGSDYEVNNPYQKYYENSKIKIIDRNIIPCSSTNIRENPFKYWKFIPNIVKKEYVKKILIIGNESTGKTTTVQTLANLYNTNCVLEYGRDICKKCGGVNYMNDEDFEEILYQHKINIQNKSKCSNKLLFIDTDAFTTFYFRNLLLNEKSKIMTNEHIINQINENYDLILFLESDTPYIDDSLRINELNSEKNRNFYTKQIKDIYFRNNLNLRNYKWKLQSKIRKN